MNAHPKYHLIGNAGASVRRLLEIEGLWLCCDADQPNALVPIVSMDGRLYAIAIDQELDPGRFIPSARFFGPFLPSDVLSTQPGEGVNMIREFNIRIQGQLGENVLPTELHAPNGVLQKAWGNFRKELAAGGLTIQSGAFENAGKTINLPVGETVTAPAGA